MAAITLRTGPSGKGSPLSLEEVDANFTALNIEVGKKLYITDYTKEDVLAKIKLVDGTDSGLDADLVRGLPSSATTPTVEYKASVVIRDASGNFEAVNISSNLTGSVTGNVTGSLYGNADTATKLQTARPINGVNFDGTQGITIYDATKVLKAGDTMTGFLTLNAQPVNDLHAATKSYVDEYGCPKGAIIMWSGTTLPAHRGLCDGTVQNGIQTPDLRNKFIYGANTLADVKGTGGSLSPMTTTTAGSHAHGNATGGHALTQNEMPAHAHYYNDIRGGIDDGSGPMLYDRYGNLIDTWTQDDASAFTDEDGDIVPLYSEMATSSIGGNASHSHSISSDGTHNHTVTPNLPPYIVLAYIIKLI
jgi:hypothetical protein